jgi:hypothetical protein
MAIVPLIAVILPMTVAMLNRAAFNRVALDMLSRPRL